MRLLTASLLAVLTAVPIPAQTRSRTVPKVFTGHYANTANLLPFARTKGFIQTWYHGQNLPVPTPILELGWRIDNAVNAPAHTAVIEIVLTSTPATFATLSKTFASNLGTDATVFFSLKSINLPAQNLPNDPDTPALWIKGDRPFVFLGPHFLVQVDVQTAATPVSTTYYADAYSTAATNTTLHSVSEASCGGTIAATHSVTTNQYDVRVAGGVPNRFAIFMLGRENTRAGGIPLPIDLSSAGMTGCVLGVDPLIMVSMPLDGSGSATLSLPYALPPGGESLVVHAQALHSSTANATGLATTAVAHSILGGTDLTNYLYNWTIYNPSAEFGPYPTNRGAVILLRP